MIYHFFNAKPDIFTCFIYIRDQYYSYFGQTTSMCERIQINNSGYVKSITNATNILPFELVE